ncbi:ABC transporter ATP-binding protein [Janthinobacterium agaricidamnosum]|uniref:ABC transporter family protein n=1 Tax=Janthinobacterium agaricidamnosum NBRC 102515 = DSM 9628 TaxID=1349767 RepID=W0VC42_9BURK|nr:ATP-binding cassette domain-containing protein [Janthinobacterium agaricidamnosum]CDG85215.1 ABC transporter family protein [Janthinobacterium agaricidamnosum NBRC 102515 = DSM 9628]
MIEVKNLAKRFRLPPHKGKQAQLRDPRDQDGWFHAVRDVSFSCEPGQVLGLLGPNGAGKTTTLRLLSTALQADAGHAYVNGVDVLQQPLVARQSIGFLSGSTGLYGRLTARENVEYFGRLHGMRAPHLKQRCDDLFDLLQIHEFSHKRVDQLSTGMKQKCAIARTVVHEPQVVILDEPTSGLDVMSSKILLDFIASYKALRVPLIFSTHHLHEVEKLCDRVCIINHGKNAFNGSVDALRHLGGSADLYDAFVSVINQEP